MVGKIIYSPVFPVLFAVILLVIGIRYGGFAFQSRDIISSTIIPAFEPDAYNATVIQVGGVGSDIYTNRAYYIGDGSGIHQEGWSTYLNKDMYARVSFNTPFYLMTLSCKDGYDAILLPNETSDLEAYSDADASFTLEVKDQIKNQLSIRCKKRVKETIEEECKRIVDSGLEDSGSKIDSNKTAIEIVKKDCLWISDSSFMTDFDGDGRKEVVLVTVGAGCGSCHAQEIRIIKDDKVIFYKDGSDFIIELTNNPIGFTLQYPVTNITDPESGYIIENYKARTGVNGVDGFDKVREEKKEYEFK